MPGEVLVSTAHTMRGEAGGAFISDSFVTVPCPDSMSHEAAEVIVKTVLALRHTPETVQAMMHAFDGAGDPLWTADELLFIAQIAKVVAGEAE